MAGDLCIGMAFKRAQVVHWYLQSSCYSSNLNQVSCFTTCKCLTAESHIFMYPVRQVQSGKSKCSRLLQLCKHLQLQSAHVHILPLSDSSCRLLGKTGMSHQYCASAWVAEAFNWSSIMISCMQSANTLTWDTKALLPSDLKDLTVLGKDTRDGPVFQPYASSRQESLTEVNLWRHANQARCNYTMLSWGLWNSHITSIKCDFCVTVKLKTNTSLKDFPDKGSVRAMDEVSVQELKLFCESLVRASCTTEPNSFCIEPAMALLEPRMP